MDKDKQISNSMINGKNENQGSQISKNNGK
jgi:hypothetical protein